MGRGHPRLTRAELLLANLHLRASERFTDVSRALSCDIALRQDDKRTTMLIPVALARLAASANPRPRPTLAARGVARIARRTLAAARATSTESIAGKSS